MTIREQEYELVRRFRSGDEDAALRGLLALHEGFIFKFMKRWVRRYGIDEVRSVALNAAWEAVRDFDMTRGLAFTTLLGWKLRRNISLLRRKPKKYIEPFQLQSFAADAEAQPSYFERIETSEDHEVVKIRAAIDRLPPHERKVIDAVLAGQKFTNLCHHFGLSRQRVSQIKKQAMYRIKRDLAGNPIRTSRVLV